jgi:hypothetical protein
MKYGLHCVYNTYQRLLHRSKREKYHSDGMCEHRWPRYFRITNFTAERNRITGRRIPNMRCTSICPTGGDRDDYDDRRRSCSVLGMRSTQTDRNRSDRPSYRLNDHCQFRFSLACADTPTFPFNNRSYPCLRPRLKNLSLNS